MKTLYVQVADPDGAPSTSSPTAPSSGRCWNTPTSTTWTSCRGSFPAHTNPADDVAMMKQIFALRAGGQRVDGIGLDLESSEVADVPLRNRRAVTSPRQTHAIVGDSMPVAAIVYTPHDAAELTLVRWALVADLPIFGICRGIQLLNVAAGGSLYQDLPAQMPAAPKTRLRPSGFTLGASRACGPRRRRQPPGLAPRHG